MYSKLTISFSEAGCTRRAKLHPKWLLDRQTDFKTHTSRTRYCSNHFSHVL